jgi:hypothetical protein
MNKRDICFYRTMDGKCPIEEFLDSLSDKTVQKITWVLKLVQDLEMVPSTYFKRLMIYGNAGYSSAPGIIGFSASSSKAPLSFLPMVFRKRAGRRQESK